MLFITLFSQYLENVPIIWKRGEKPPPPPPIEFYLFKLLPVRMKVLTEKVALLLLLLLLFFFFCRTMLLITLFSQYLENVPIIWKRGEKPPIEFYLFKLFPVSLKVLIEKFALFFFFLQDSVTHNTVFSVSLRIFP